MSIEEIIRTIIREEIVAALNAQTMNETTEDETPPAPAKTSAKKSKKKRGKAKAKPAPVAAPPEPDDDDEDDDNTEDVPTTYEGLMERIKSAVMETSDSGAAKVAAQDWIEENCSTRKFSEIPVEDYPEVLAGVLDVVAAL